MTIEEKAKEYAHNNYEILVDTVNAFVTSEDYLEQGYLAGAKELEQENAELKTELTKKADTNHSLVEQMADLESKNAELKELLNCNNCSELSEEECEVCAEYSHFKCKRKDQLTKAKEIIRQFLNDYPVITKELLDKLEQFIKDVEK